MVRGAPPPPPPPPQSSQCGDLLLSLPGEAELDLSVATLRLLLAAPSHLPAAGLVLLALRLVLATSSPGLRLRLLLLADVGGAVLCVRELLVSGSSSGFIEPHPGGNISAQSSNLLRSRSKLPHHPQSGGRESRADTSRSQDYLQERNDLLYYILPPVGSILFAINGPGGRDLTAYPYWN